MCQDSHTSLFTPPASLTLTGSGREPRAVLYPGRCISAGPRMKWSLGGKHRLCLAARSENFSPECEKRGCRKPFPHLWYISVPSHQECTQERHPWRQQSGWILTFQSCSWFFFFLIPKALRPGFFIWILLFFKSKWTSSLFNCVTAFMDPFLTPSVDDRESRKQRQIFLLRNTWCCTGSSGEDGESCQHNCSRKIKRQKPLPERIYNTSNITKSIKAPLIHWTLTLPLGCCQIRQFGISERKAAAWQVLVTRRTKQEPLPALCPSWECGQAAQCIQATKKSCLNRILRNQGTKSAVLVQKPAALPPLLLPSPSQQFSMVRNVIPGGKERQTTNKTKQPQHSDLLEIGEKQSRLRHASPKEMRKYQWVSFATSLLGSLSLITSAESCNLCTPGERLPVPQTAAFQPWLRE